MIATNKQLLISESRVNSNRCTPCKENLIHTTRTLSAPVHVCHSYASTGSSHTWQPFVKSPTTLNRFTAPEKRAPVPIHNTLADRSTGPYPISLPQHPLKQWRKGKHLLPKSYIGLLGPYLHHVISTFKTCSRWPTHRSITNTGGGYNLEDADFPHHTLRPSQLTVLRFLLMAPPGLRLTFST
jgi:hypothetical protein